MAANYLLGTNLDFQLNQLLNAVLQVLSTAPGSPSTGQIYFDSTLGLARWWDGSAWQSGKVLSVAAADSTITIAGTTANVTVKVAKALDHTWITDFDTQVRTSRLDQMAAPTASVSMNNQLLTTLADAVSPQDAMNLRSVQALLAAISDRADCVYGTTAVLPANTYANGAAGVGATLTATGNGALSVDGQAVAVGQRVLVQNEATTANNGIYTVTATGGVGAPYILTRATDFNQASNISTGVLVPVKAPTGITGGTTNDGKIFISVCPSPITVGTSGISFTLVGSAYSAGTGLTLTGTQFSLTSPVAVLLGGTGATTAAAARTNLGVEGTFESTVGNGALTDFTVTHNLNNAYPRVACFNIATGVEVHAGVQSTGVNTCTVTVVPAPTTNNLRIKVSA